MRQGEDTFVSPFSAMAEGGGRACFPPRGGIKGGDCISIPVIPLSSILILLRVTPHKQCNNRYDRCHPSQSPLSAFALATAQAKGEKMKFLCLKVLWSYCPNVLFIIFLHLKKTSCQLPQLPSISKKPNPY